ncbi:unnamed protein product [Menidia menidia]|uniref:(Atlantic silverside) hypothetical protein n=1 Tax=Menidia menidia TaxID=238744 RepID=A0A8S4BE88_9TELE|nr:unnamed protein product [Menidia menidia]
MKKMRQTHPVIYSKSPHRRGDSEILMRPTAAFFAASIGDFAPLAALCPVMPPFTPSRAAMAAIGTKLAASATSPPTKAATADDPEASSGILFSPGLFTALLTCSTRPKKAPSKAPVATPARTTKNSFNTEALACFLTSSANLIGVILSAPCCHHLVYCLEQGLQLELVAPVVILLCVLPVFIIEDVTPAAAPLHQAAQVVILTDKLLDFHPFGQLVTMIFVNPKDNEKSVRPRRTLCDAAHDLSLHLILRPPAVKKTRGVNQTSSSPGCMTIRTRSGELLALSCSNPETSSSSTLATTVSGKRRASPAPSKGKATDPNPL